MMKISDNKLIRFPGLPSELNSLIVDFKNDIETKEFLVNHVQKHVLKEMKEDVAERIWWELTEMYWEYEQCYDDWKQRNGLYFDQDLTENLRDDMYALYDEYKHMLIPYKYIPAKECNCCRYCAHRRVNICQCLLPDCGGMEKVSRCNAAPCCSCIRTCDIFYNLEHRELWTDQW